MPPLQLQPRGSTALLDAIGRQLNEAGARLAALPEHERPASVIVGIMTDGKENASREFTHPQIKAMIEQQTGSYGWQFLYMGADQDAIEVGSSIGVAAARSVPYSRGRTREVMAASAANVSAYRAARAAGMAHVQAGPLIGYDAAQRAASLE